VKDGNKPIKGKPNEGQDARARCSCGWYGSWRTSRAQAEADMVSHCQETGHEIGVQNDRSQDLTDDLMPHERRRIYGR